MASVIYRRDGKVDFISNCRVCRVTVHIAGIPAEGYAAWRKGEIIASALPDLSTNNREFLISEICGHCFDHATQITEEGK